LHKLMVIPGNPGEGRGRLGIRELHEYGCTTMTLAHAISFTIVRLLP
jgi:hypothetical protein